MSTAAPNLMGTESPSLYRQKHPSNSLYEEVEQWAPIRTPAHDFRFKGPPGYSSDVHSGVFVYSHYEIDAVGTNPAVGLVPWGSRDEANARLLSLFPLKADDRLKGPVQFILKLLEQWDLQRDDAPALLGFEDTDSLRVEAALNGMEELRGRDVNDRIAYLFHVRQTLHSLFRDLDVENNWLRESHDLLAGRSPMDLLLGGHMEDLLLLREYVDAAAGR